MTSTSPGTAGPASYYREIVFGLRSDPYLAVLRPERHGRELSATPWAWSDTVGSWSWTGAEGRPVTVEVYSDADEVELLLDGTSLGTAKTGEANRYRAEFEVTYVPGELTAVARTAGEETGRFSLRSATGPFGLAAVADRDVIRADDTDLAYVALTLQDADGVVARRRGPRGDRVRRRARGARRLRQRGTGDRGVLPRRRAHHLRRPRAGGRPPDRPGDDHPDGDGVRLPADLTRNRGPLSSLRIGEQCRVVVDNDWAGDPDGLVALAHHLLSPTNRVVGVTSSFLNPIFEAPPGAAAGAALARELVQLIDGPTPPVHEGSETPFGPGGAPSAASDAIVAAAHADDDLPLYLVCGGPLTNVAAALQQDAGIAERLVLVWIGGALDPAAPEYNRDTDQEAAEFVLGHPSLEVWQFPLETYRTCAYSVAELEQDIGGSGQVGRWLWERFTSLPLPDFIRLGGVWPLGDSPPLLVTALGDESSTCTTTPASPGRGARRVYTDVDVRLLVADMLARLRLHETRRRTAAVPDPQGESS